MVAIISIGHPKLLVIELGCHVLAAEQGEQAARGSLVALLQELADIRIACPFGSQFEHQ
ncbi:hypothetical protein [Rhodanobacter lindaniclasticus]